jgi:hypothetical protein
MAGNLEYDFAGAPKKLPQGMNPGLAGQIRAVGTPVAQIKTMPGSAQ